MKPKNLILLFIFGLFLFLLPSFAEAECKLYCSQYSFVGGGAYCYGKPPEGCFWGRVDLVTIPLIGCFVDYAVGGAERIGTLDGKVTEVSGSYCPDATYCVQNCSGCKLNGFPSGSNGESCTARDRSLSGLSCNNCFKSGKWDASQSQCVECSGKIENRILGNTSSVGDVCNDNFPSGNGKCESACGASSACDEKNPGDSCGTGKECDSDCQCVTVAKSCSEACLDAGYDNGLCFTASTTCSAQGYPYSYNRYCHYNCSSKSGTTCSGTCLCFDTDSSEPSCNYYSSGSTCYYNGSSICTNSGWDCDYDTCNMIECCDCVSTGCDPNDANCNTGLICDSNCYCQGPDLYIVDIEPFSTDKKVYYTIKNQGDADAGSSKSSLYVDGSYQTYDSVSSISAGSSRDEYFSGWTCTAGQTYSIQVCADKDNVVIESNETNNCRTESLTCPSAEPTGTLSCSSSTTSSITLSYSFSNGTNVSLFRGSTLLKTFSGSSGSGNYTDSGLSAGTSYTYRLRNGTTTTSTLLASATCTTQTTPNNPPTCNYLSASPTSGNAPLNVSFTANGSDSDGTIAQYEFDFGDGSSKVYSSTAGATHTYNAVGTYCAKLRVKDDDGAWSTNTGNCPGGTCTAQITVTEAGVAINPPIVTTNNATPVTQTSATLNGTLNSLGYDPGTCPNCQCIVWFEWGTSGTAGVSGSYGHKTSPVSMTAAGSIPPVTISGLTSGQTYYFEAFAKNGGSW